MTPDSELLAAFARKNSEDAFAELVKRHVNLVYSAALRQVNGDAHLAQDVAQTVFTDLARKAGSLAERESLTGWLYTSAHFAAAKIARGETRRRDREEKFMREPENSGTGVSPVQSANETEWETLRPALDAAMHELKAADREAILLRYFENRAFAEVGAKLGLNENAARMRVDRALEKLRAVFAKRGVTATATLASVISANAVQLAPAGLAAMLTSASLATVASGTAGTLTLLKYMIMTKLKFGIISAVIVAAIATPLVIQHRAEVKLREQEAALRHQNEQLARLTAENQRLAQLVAQARSQSLSSLPAPPLHATAPAATSPTDDVQTNNLMQRLLKGETPKLTPEQVEAYLKENHRNAASLLAMFRATGDSALLREALEKFPQDPRVNFAGIFDKDATPAELRQRLDAFKQSAPDNALANYLSALNYFKSGQTGLAVQELNAAYGKPGFQDYSWDFVQNAAEAWRSAGYSEAETSMVATWQLMLPQLRQLRDLNQQIVDLANSYKQSGDAASAQAALQMDVNLGQQMDSTPTVPLITQLVGLAIERNALHAMDPNSPYGTGGQTVQGALDQLTQQSTAIKDLSKQVEALQEAMSPQDWINYNERTKTFGEMNALQWLLDKYGQQ